MSRPGATSSTSVFRCAHTVFCDELATLRFNCQNIGDTHCYSIVAAGDIKGANASSDVAHLDLPRTISTSLPFAF